MEKNGSPVWPNIDSVDMTKFDFGDNYFNPRFIITVEALEMLIWQH